MSPMERKRGGWRRNNNDCYMMWRWEVWSGLSSDYTVTRGRGVSVVGVRPDHPSGRETLPRGAAPPLRAFARRAPGLVGGGRRASARPPCPPPSLLACVRAPEEEEEARGGGGGISALGRMKMLRGCRCGGGEGGGERRGGYSGVGFLPMRRHGR